MSYNKSSSFLSSLIYDANRVNETTVGARFIDMQGGAWELKSYERGVNNGYQGAVFLSLDTNSIVLANRGTEPIDFFGDIRNDLSLAIGQVPSQFSSAEGAYREAIRIAQSEGLPSESIVVTGHSLGGSLAQLIGAKYGAQAVTFNAYGIGNLLDQLGISDGDFANILNNVIDGDLVSVSPGSKMIGNTLDYFTANDKFWNSQPGKFIAAFQPAPYTSYRISSHSIDLFNNPALASQPGRPVSINVSSVTDWYSPVALAAKIADAVATTFQVARTFVAASPVFRDPLTLDLDNDGLETVGINTGNPILFDHTGDGVKTATGWVKPDDGFLVLDRNGNGTIDSGKELFGDSTPLYAGGLAPDGFGALAQEDSNGDGRVDSLDAHFSQLRVWRDLNQDGISQSNELFTLGQLGIAALKVAKTENARLLDNGNQLADLGGFIRADGSAGTLGLAEQLADINLASNPFYSQFSDHVPLTAAARGLPDMQGAGMVRSLREAASLPTAAGAELARQLTQYSVAATRTEQLALLDGLVQAWAATSTMPSRSITQFYNQPEWSYVWDPIRMRYFWSSSPASPFTPDLNQRTLTTLKVLDAFNGSEFPGESFYAGQLSLLNQSRAAINSSVYGGLILQTRLKPYVDAITLDIGANGVSLNYTGMVSLLDARKAADTENAVFDLLDLSKYVGSQLTGWDWPAELESWVSDQVSGAAVKSAMIAAGFAMPSGAWVGGSGDDSAFGSAGVDQLSGNAGDDVLMGGAGNDVLLGNAGSDFLSGGSGADVLAAGNRLATNASPTDQFENTPNTLQGGLGSDQLYGGGGSDTYRFNLGDGADTITEIGYMASPNSTMVDSATDRIELGEGIAPADVVVTRSGTNLILKFARPGDQITITAWYGPVTQRIEQLAFADGTVWDRATLHAAGLVVQGTAGAEVLNGLAGEADQLYGNAGNDTLIGDTGKDILVGGAGADLLMAGTGSPSYGLDYSAREGDANTLEGGLGNDLLYGGGGSDTYRFNIGDGADTIYETFFSPDGVTRSDTGVDQILLGAGISPADITVTRSSLNLILKFASAGDQLTVNAWYGPATQRIEQLVFADGTVWDRTMLHNAGLVVTGTPGNDLLAGLATENDLLMGGAGNDTLIGEAGRDTLQGGAGNDELRAASAVAPNGSDLRASETDANTLEGGAGSDLLYGGGGPDTYRYNLGDGADRIFETSYVSADNASRSDTAIDRIVLGAGIVPADVTVTRSSSDLIIRFANAGDQITIPYWYNASGVRVEQLVFADGTVWDRSQLHNAGLVVYGTEGADTLYGLPSEADVLDGLGGNDQLMGDKGNDVYLFGLGSGQDTISEYDATPGNVDTIRIKAGVSPNAVTLAQVSTALSLSIKGTSDKITVANWFSGANYWVERIEFLDGANGTAGTVWSAAEIDRALAVARANVAPVLAVPIVNQTATEDAAFVFSVPSGTFTDANAGDHLSYSAALGTGGSLPTWLSFDSATQRFTGLPNDTSAGQWSLRVTATDDLGASISGGFVLDVANHVSGTSADDILAGTAFRDVIDGAAGNDTLSGFAGSDTLRGGLGDDMFVIDDATTVLIENADEGRDTVQSTVGYTLASNVENLILLGTSALDGSGNALDNLLTGNAAANVLSGGDGNDTLNGGSGADTLIGGTGNDVYVVDSLNDVILENAGDGIDSVQTALSYTLGANLETLILTGTAAAKATGNVLNNLLTGNAAANSLSGGSGDDTLDGGAGKDTLNGGPGDDTYLVDNIGDVVVEAANDGIDGVTASVSYQLADNVENLMLSGVKAISATGNALNNVLTGNMAANVLNGGAGSDTLIGNAGNDTFVVDDAGDVVVEAVAEGSDTVQSYLSYVLGANLENLTLLGDAALLGTGNELNNLLTGNAAPNKLEGGAGNDTLNGGAGADNLIGGLGNDVYVVDDVGDLVVELTDEGIDTVQSAATYTLGDNLENLTLTGTAAVDATGNRLNNYLTGNSAGNTLAAGNGNDTLNGGAGRDTLIGGTGNDIYLVDDPDDVVIENADEGIDTVTSSANYVLGANVESLTLTGVAPLSGSGNELNNHLTGNGGDNVLNGGLGNDTLSGAAGLDTLIGGLGDDSFTIDNSGDVVIELAGEGNDIINSSVTFELPANVERLTLTGTAAIDGSGNGQDNLLIGNSGANILFGGAGNDTLNGGLGIDTLVGGPGNDSYTVENMADTVVEKADEGIDLVTASVSYSLPDNTENLLLAGLTAVEGIGNALNNVLTGNSIGNILTGGAGNDVLDGKAGIDTLSGGPGDDIYVADNVADVIVENADEGMDIVYASVSRTLDPNADILILAGSASLSATGNVGRNLLRGNVGNNILDGKSGVDLLEGLAGNDTLTDLIDNNYFYGGPGNDKLTAGAGNDLLIGGSGNDTINGGDGNDVVDFNRGDGYDTLYVGVNERVTISLGGGIIYAELSFRKVGNDLLLDTGHGDGIVFKNWYLGTTNKNVFNLQVVAEAMLGFDPNSANPLLSKKVQGFDFKGLVSAFDAARLVAPTTTSWSLTNALEQNRAWFSDGNAYGGDLAYLYGRSGSLAGVGINSAFQAMADPQFGVQVQGLHPFSLLQDGVIQLV